MFEGNLLVLYCVIFTVSLIVMTIASTIWGGRIYLSIEFLLWNFVFISAPLLPLGVFKHLWKSNRIHERDYIFWVSVPLHYLISCGLTALFVFIQGLFMPLSQGVYFIALVNYTIMYAIILIGAAAIDLLQTSAANRNLKKIQERTGGGC
jgi:hypothetical protein